MPRTHPEEVSLVLLIKVPAVDTESEAGAWNLQSARKQAKRPNKISDKGLTDHDGRGEADGEEL